MQQGPAGGSIAASATHGPLAKESRRPVGQGEVTPERRGARSTGQDVSQGLGRLLDGSFSLPASPNPEPPFGLSLHLRPSPGTPGPASQSSPGINQ